MTNLLGETSLVVRPMESGDAQEIAVLIAQLGYKRGEESVRSWIAALDSEGQRQMAYVACVDAEIAGWIEVSMQHRLQSPPFALIGGLVVKDKFRGRGIGRCLCERAEAWSWQQQAEVLRVTSRSTREDAHRFYLRDGYLKVKTSLVFEKKRPADS